MLTTDMRVVQEPLKSKNSKLVELFKQNTAVMNQIVNFVQQQQPLGETKWNTVGAWNWTRVRQGIIIFSSVSIAMKRVISILIVFILEIVNSTESRFLNCWESGFRTISVGIITLRRWLRRPTKGYSSCMNVGKPIFLKTLELHFTTQRSALY